MRQNLTVPERHQLNIARKTLKMSDLGVLAMGGTPNLACRQIRFMTKDEARLVIKRLTGRTVMEDA